LPTRRSSDLRLAHAAVLVEAVGASRGAVEVQRLATLAGGDQLFQLLRVPGVEADHVPDWSVEHDVVAHRHLKGGAGGGAASTPPPRSIRASRRRRNTDVFERAAWLFHADEPARTTADSPSTCARYPDGVHACNNRSDGVAPVREPVGAAPLVQERHQDLGD